MFSADTYGQIGSYPYQNARFFGKGRSIIEHVCYGLKQLLAIFFSVVPGI
jgi:hypothetical protein